MSPLPLGVLGSAHVAASGGGALAADYVTVVTDEANATTYTFTAANIGAAAADRTVVVAFGARAAGNLTVNSVTIGGSAATIDRQAANSGSIVAFAHLAVPAGTTATIAVTLNGGAVRAGIGIWRVTGTAAITQADEDTASGNSGTVTVAIPADGVGMVSAVSSLNASVFTFTNSTDDYGLGIGSEAGRIAGGRLTADSSTFSATGTPQVVAVAYAPA